MHTRSYFTFLIGMALLVGMGCSSRSVPVAVVPPPPPPVPPPLAGNFPLNRVSLPPSIAVPPQPQFDPVEEVMDKATAAFRRGEKNYTAGHLEMAKQDFNAAVATVLQSPVALTEDKRLQKTFDSLVERIHSYEVEALKQGDGFAEPSYQPAPVDELQTLTFPEDPQVNQLVREDAVGGVSEIPLVTNAQVESIVKHFTVGRGRATLEAAWKRAGRYRDMIQRILDEEGVPQELIHLAQAESGFQPRARSYAAAVGIWQFMAFRGKEYGLDRNWWEDERINPEEATRAAARHLKDLYTQFGDWYLAMAAYHCGPVCVQRAVERTGYADFWELSRRRVLPVTTRNYVPVIIAFIIIGKNPEKYGMDDLALEPSWAYDTVTVTAPTDLRLVAEIVGTSAEEMRDLNPSLLRMTTPRVPEYTLRIPLATKDVFLKRIAMIPPEKRVFWRWHTVRHGENLSAIARKFKTSVLAIAEVNNLDPEEPLYEAAELVIPVTQADSREVRHVVRAKETLSQIARRYNVSPAQLMAWNGLESTVLKKGTALTIPPPGARSSAAESVATNGRREIARTSSASKNGASRPTAVVHRVRKGESLWHIASNYNTSVEALRQSNGHLGEILRIGDRVVIPASK